MVVEEIGIIKTTMQGEGSVWSNQKAISRLRDYCKS